MSGQIMSAEGKFYIGDSEDQPLAYILYQINDDGQMVIEETFVAESGRGQGLGAKLVERAAVKARSEKRKIIAHCSYARKILGESDQYKDLLLE